MLENQTPKIRVTRKLTFSVEQRLKENFDVVFNPDDAPLARDELYKSMQEYDALVVTVSDQVEAEMLQCSSRRVGMIANVGVGFSNIDTDVARAMGIAVSNTPDVLTDATADIAMFLILAATRHTFCAERTLRTNEWTGFSIVDGLGASIQGKTLGIVGMGRIGRATARRAALGFGMKVIYYNRSPVPDIDPDFLPLKSIEAVMSQADVVSVHVTGGSLSPPITASHIASMKPTAYLVNTARGDSIDQEALVDALVAGRIAGAGLDVFADEPRVPDQLRKLENVSLLPHIGSATYEVRTAMGIMAAENIEAFFSGADLPNRVV